MTHNKHITARPDTHHTDALHAARRLTDDRPEGATSVAWFLAAQHFGDMTVAALALRQ
jgi:hypothetical protein